MTGQFITARQAARQPNFLYRDNHGDEVQVETAVEWGTKKHVNLVLCDGREIVVDWNHRLRIVKP